MNKSLVTRKDIETALRVTLNGKEDGRGASSGPIITGAVILSFALFGAAYLIGRRMGKRSSTTVEIRRI